MRSNPLALAVALLAVGQASRPGPATAAGWAAQLAQYSTGAPDQTINGRPLQDAPVPPPAAGVAPVDRVAGPGSRSLSAGPVNATPFSAAPQSGQASGSPASPNGEPGGDVTPNLGK